MKNFALSILLAATCQIVTATGFNQSEIEILQVRSYVIEETSLSSHDQVFFRKIEDTVELQEQEVETEFRGVCANASFSPYYFVSKVELRSRSTLDADHLA